MRIAVFFCMAVALAACQTTFGSGVTSSRQDIATPITLGNAPVVNGRAYDRLTITGYKQGHSGSISVVTETRIDVQRVGACVHLRTEVKKVKSEFRNIMEHWENIYRMQFSSRIGETVNYEADLDETEITAVETRRGNASPKIRDRVLIFSILVEQLHLGGETVVQNAELLRYRFGDLMPGLEPAQADLYYSLRAVGQAIFKERPVIVAETEGHIWIEDEPMAIDATVLIDIETGVSVHADTHLRNLSGEGRNTRIRMVRDFDKDYGVDLAEKGVAKALEPVRPELLGECFNDV